MFNDKGLTAEEHVSLAMVYYRHRHDQKNWSSLPYSARFRSKPDWLLSLSDSRREVRYHFRAARRLGFTGRLIDAARHVLANAR